MEEEKTEEEEGGEASKGLWHLGERDLGKERPFKRGSINRELLSSSSEEMMEGRGLDLGLAIGDAKPVDDDEVLGMSKDSRKERFNAGCCVKS